MEMSVAIIYGIRFPKSKCQKLREETPKWCEHASKYDALSHVAYCPECGRKKPDRTRMAPYIDWGAFPQGFYAFLMRNYTHTCPHSTMESLFTDPTILAAGKDDCEFIKLRYNTDDYFFGRRLCEDIEYDEIESFNQKELDTIRLETLATFKAIGIDVSPELHVIAWTF